MNTERLKTVLKTKKLLRAMEKGSADLAVKIFYELYAQASSECVEAMQSAYANLRAQEGQLFVMQFPPHSKSHKLLVDHANLVCTYYLDCCEKYAERMDERPPFDKQEFFIKFLTWARQCPQSFRANTPWSFNNVSGTKATEYALGMLNYWFYKIADPTPKVTQFAFQEFCKIFNSTHDFFSSVNHRARLVMLVDRLASQFGTDRRDEEKLTKAVSLALNVSAQTYNKVNQDNQDKEASDHVKFGFLVGRDINSTNTSIERIIQAVKDYEARKQKVEEPVEVNVDDLNLD